ncbi:MAG TPA: hypothetical protein VLE97_01790 [Gaiellaceae bacterium]|nr:hypothetical protein [Gaiellaceae bacterium]
MRKVAYYTPVKLHMIGFVSIEPGSFMVAEPSGATYLVTSARKSKKIRGKTNLDCLRWPPDAVDAAAIVHRFTWNKRVKRKSRTLRDLRR